MSTAIFINLPVRDLKASTDFFAKTGFAIDESLTTDEAACVVVGENIYALLVTASFFRESSRREIAVTATHCEAMLALQVESRTRVDELVDAAVGAGGESDGDPIDEGFMYSRGFRDLDGHLWHVLTMQTES